MSKKTASMEIMKALSGVDEDLLERSESGKGDAVRKKRSAGRLWISLGSCAAAVCFTAAGVAGWRGIQISEEQMYQELFSPEPAPMSLADEGGDGTQTDEQFLPKEGQTSGEIQQGADIAGQGELERQATPEELKSAALGNPTAAESENTVGQESDGVGQKFDGVEQESDGIDSDSVEMRVDSAIYDKDVVTQGTPLDTSEKLTEEQARQVEVLGAYVPTAPAGYVFEGASLYQTAEERSLSVSWTKGMDYIMVSMSIVDEEETDVIDVSRPECFDERLYDIPYCDTVPEEYRETVDHPVFAAADFSLDIVKSRVLNRGEDRGDTNTPRGDFYVLYPGGVLVRFNGKATPEQVWDMLSPLSESAAPAP